MSAEKKFSLNLPLKVILTEEGASHFISHKIKLLRFRLADNIEEYGISLNPFSPQSLQNMILVNYISKIEISMSEFVSVRQEVMDLSKVVVYSLLYKQFDRQLFADFIQFFNCKHSYPSLFLNCAFVHIFCKYAVYLVNGHSSVNVIVNHHNGCKSARADAAAGIKREYAVRRAFAHLDAQLLFKPFKDFVRTLYIAGCS